MLFLSMVMAKVFAITDCARWYLNNWFVKLCYTEDGMNQVWGPLWRDFRLQYLPLAQFEAGIAVHVSALFISLYLYPTDTRRRIFSPFLISHLAKAALVLSRLRVRASVPRLPGEIGGDIYLVF
jgi:hypothetical protein